jgi:hypothetical protein
VTIRPTRSKRPSLAYARKGVGQPATGWPTTAVHCPLSPHAGSERLSHARDVSGRVADTCRAGGRRQAAARPPSRETATEFCVDYTGPRTLTIVTCVQNYVLPAPIILEAEGERRAHESHSQYVETVSAEQVRGWSTRTRGGTLTP